MKLIPCPLNGLRPEDEFVCGGRIRAVPPEDASDAAWRDYLFFDENLPGEIWEWWCHSPSGFWFAARRDTMRDLILETCSAEEAEKAAAGVAKKSTTSSTKSAAKSAAESVSTKSAAKKSADESAAKESSAPEKSDAKSAAKQSSESAAAESSESAAKESSASEKASTKSAAAEEDK